ncbi:MAG TPA: hypothetical protein PLV61_12465 [Parvularculaceae bacterium]|nr:hypothetical protein [Parvularculaceae bacterium]
MRKSVGVLVFLASAVCVSPPGNAQNAKETVNSLLQEMGCEKVLVYPGDKSVASGGATTGKDAPGVKSRVNRICIDDDSKTAYWISSLAAMNRRAYDGEMAPAVYLTLLDNNLESLWSADDWWQTKKGVKHPTLGRARVFSCGGNAVGFAQIPYDAAAKATSFHLHMGLDYNGSSGCKTSSPKESFDTTLRRLIVFQKTGKCDDCPQYQQSLIEFAKTLSLSAAGTPQ